MPATTSLQLFIHVTKTESFSATARHFDITPSAVSRSISQLEQELGARLFQRTTRQLALTEAGYIYLQYAERVVYELQSAKNAITELKQNPQGILRIAAESAFAEAVLQPLLADFYHHYPNIAVYFSLSSSLIDVVHDEIDIAVRMGELQSSSLIAKHLMASQSVVCASPNYFQHHGQPATPQDLSQYNCLSFKPDQRKLQWPLQYQGQPYKPTVSGNFRANSLSMLKTAALQGMGIIMIPEWFVHQELQTGKLTPLPFSSSTNNVYAVFASKTNLAPKIRAFVDFFSQQLTKNYLIN